MDIGIIIAIITAIGGPLVAYLAAARKLSGRIDTSEASSLWSEAGNLRKEYRDEIDDLRQLITRLRLRIDELEKSNDKLLLEIRTLKNGSG